MLIVINGVETVHRKWFAESVFKAMNTFTVDNYSVKFIKNTYKVTSLISTSTSATVVTIINGETVTSIEPISFAEGEVVFDGIDNINKLLLWPTGGDTLDKIENLYQTDIITHTRHYANVFVDLEHDLGDKPFEGEGNPEYCYPTDYNTLINSYNNFNGETFVISGGFSRHTLDKIKTDIGENNVKIINIIRHPNACVAMHWKSDEHFNKNPTYTKDFHNERLPKSIINAANLIQYSDVDTIRFEDIVKNKKFIVNGFEIPAPEDHVMYNQYITSYEKSYAEIELAKYSKEGNAEYIAGYDIFSAELQNLSSSSGVSWAPTNLFAILGYTPVDFNTLLEPDAP